MRRYQLGGDAEPCIAFAVGVQVAMWGGFCQILKGVPPDVAETPPRGRRPTAATLWSWAPCLRTSGKWGRHSKTSSMTSTL